MNSQNEITQLYNALFELESKFKNDENYPIHKKLDFKGKFNDIYELIISLIEIKGKSILDAGCGVGFGSIMLLQNGAKKVLGISVSDKEIERANKGKEKLEFKNIEFKKSTFDETLRNKYDIIICVESLKHSLAFDNSLQALLNGLKPNGKLCIVDDFFDENHNKTSSEFAKNWHLNFLISQKDIEIISNDFSTSVKDLTHFVPKKLKLKTEFSIALFRLLKKKSAFKKLFLGGLLLDKLYVYNQMKYLLVVITKKE
jgi:SAM-dependent methyltransferase